MPRGYDRPLYLLPFDHRGSFESGMFGWTPPLSAAQTAQIAGAKRIIYDAYRMAVAGGVPPDKSGILVDEQFGADILRDAAAASYTTAAPAEKSGQDEFDFEYGDDFASHIEKFKPTFCKVLVRYNPDADRDLNRRQSTRLARLSDYLAEKAGSRFLFELLVPATAEQKRASAADPPSYDLKLRPALMVRAIEELQAGGVEPDIWKIEGVDRPEDARALAEAARAGGRDHVRCIVLGHAADSQSVQRWLTVAAQTSGYIGFAVGRTVFWEPLTQWRDSKATREQTVSAISGRYRGYVDLFEQEARSRVGPVDVHPRIGA
jgi:5-dehydro-2-deoxygluconokinase